MIVNIRTGCRIILMLLGSGFLAGTETDAQNFYFGNDLSYVNQMEDCGAVFKEGMQPKDVYRIFADHGTNLVRVRLWIDPSWWQAPLSQPSGVKSYYNDIVDVTETIRRAKEAGMQVMLDLHLSDFWADPGQQLIPRRWIPVAYDINRLKDSVYAYTYNTLTELDRQGLMPEIVKVGNETNPGILMHIPEASGYAISATVSTSWSRHGILFNSAIKAIRDAGSGSAIKPKIAIHFSSSLTWQASMFSNFLNNAKVTDFDIMGISYYYAWHQGNVRQLESAIRSMAATFPGYQIMVVETGYLWTQQNFDQLGNIINIPDPEYLPVTPAKQLEYLVDYTRAVMRGGGIGVVFWEPAWVSTPCRTPWGVGSSHDHVVFFDPVHTNFMENGGGRWMESPYYKDLTTRKVSFKVDMAGQDTTNGVFITGSFTGDPWKIMPMTSEGAGIFSYYTYIKPSEEGGYLFLNSGNMSGCEKVPEGCAIYRDTCRRYRVYDSDKIYGYKWGSCTYITENNPDEVEVTFAVNMAGQDVSRGVYITGHLTGDPWKIVRMNAKNDSIYFYKTYLLPGRSGAFYFMTTSTWTDYLKYRETVPAECVKWWNSDRGYVIPDHDTVFSVYWASCKSFNFVSGISSSNLNQDFHIYPNPSRELLNIRFNSYPDPPVLVQILDLMGNTIKQDNYSGGPLPYLFQMDVTSIPAGIYVLQFRNNVTVTNQKILIQ